MFRDPVFHFRGNLRDQVKGCSPKKLKSLIRVPYIPHVKVQVLNFNMILISSPWRVPRPSYPFQEILGDHVKGRSPKRLKLKIEGRSQKKLKSLIRVPYVAHLKVKVLIFNMILISSP